MSREVTFAGRHWLSMPAPQSRILHGFGFKGLKFSTKVLSGEGFLINSIPYLPDWEIGKDGFCEGNVSA